MHVSSYEMYTADRYKILGLYGQNEIIPFMDSANRLLFKEEYKFSKKYCIFPDTIQIFDGWNVTGASISPSTWFLSCQNFSTGVQYLSSR